MKVKRCFASSSCCNLRARTERDRGGCALCILFIFRVLRAAALSLNSNHYNTKHCNCLDWIGLELLVSRIRTHAQSSSSASLQDRIAHDREQKRPTAAVLDLGDRVVTRGSGEHAFDLK